MLYSSNNNILLKSYWLIDNCFEFSEQQVADCSSTYGNFGCDGGWPDVVWQYVAATGGLDTGASYPYTSGKSGAVIKFLSYTST